MAGEWKTYIEPRRHERAEVNEDNVLDFCREYGWTLSFREKKVAPYPHGRATVMEVSGIGGPRIGRSGATEVPFWVEMRGDQPWDTTAPHPTWEVED
jgi:hypothetical protein